MVRETQKSVAMQEFSAEYDLRYSGEISTFRVVHDGLIERAGKGSDLVAIFEWTAERDYFSDRDLVAAFPSLKSDGVVYVLGELIAANRIIKIA